MDVNTEWWKSLFDDIYLITDARSVCDEELTRREVDLIETYLEPNKEDSILDLCGGEGRHSLEMAKRGYKRLTVLDFSSFLIKRGRTKALSRGYSICFLRGDARQISLKGHQFHYIILMANSFGYCSNDKDNIRILHEVYRLLTKGGEILLDLCDPDYVTNNFKPYSQHEANKDILVYRERILNSNKIMTTESVISKTKGLIRKGTYYETIYKEEKISDLFTKVGFKEIEVRRNFTSHIKQDDYGFMTSRMVVRGRR